MADPNGDMFDLERLRRNWTEPSEATSVVESGRFAKVALPIDPIVQGPAELASLRLMCQAQFDAHMHQIEPFLVEVEQAGQALLTQRAAAADEGEAEAEQQGETADAVGEGDLQALASEAHADAEAAPGGVDAAAAADGDADDEADALDDAAFAQDPQERLSQALTSLEDLLEVFMASR